MRNLVVSRHRAGLLNWAAPRGGGPSLLALDVDSGRRYFSSRGGWLCCLGPEDDAEDKIIWESSLPDLLPPDSVCALNPTLVAMVFAVEHDAVFLATACGGVLLLDPQSREVEEVGAVEDGLLAARWSPDGETLALLTTQGNLILMSKDWEVVDELQISAPLEGQSLGEEPRGSVCWRGDSGMLAVNLGTSDRSQRLTMVRKSPCEVLGVAEGLEGLQLVMDWQPNGRHLYCTCDSGSGPHVVLLEANGLQHGSFDPLKHHLPQGARGHCHALQWSANSELLGAVLELPGGIGWALQVWRRSNWHWDLKHEMRFPFTKRVEMQWDPEQAGRLRAFTGCGEQHRLDFDLQYHTSGLGTAAVVDGCQLRVTPLRHCVVPPPLCAVRLLFPQPLQCLGLWTGEGCGDAIAGMQADGALSLARSVEGDLWEETAEEKQDQNDGDDMGSNLSELSLRATGVALDSPLAVGRLPRHVVWLGPSKLAIVAGPHPGGSAGDVVIPVDLSDGDEQGAVGAEMDVREEVVCAVSRGSEVMMQVAGGSLLLFDGDVLKRLSPSAGPPSTCRWLASIPVADAPDRSWGTPGADGTACTGLDGNGTLYWGRKTLAQHVTSASLRLFGPGGAFLLYTTRDSMMHSLSLNQVEKAVAGLPIFDRALAQHSQDFKVTGGPGRRRPELPIGARRDGEENHYTAMHAAMRPTGSSHAADCTTRRVEAGAVLVSGPSYCFTAVLQMPRGNLEVVEPRALVLAAVGASLQAKDYGTAWRVARESRLDLNVIVDYAWPSFVTNTRSFVDAVQYEPDICDLMAALRPYSTLAPGGEYEAMHSAEASEDVPDNDVVPASTVAAKVSAVCRAIRRALAEVDEAAYTVAILTSHARHDPPELVQALQRIRRLREAEVSGERVAAPPPAGEVEEEEADNGGGFKAEAIASVEDRQSLAVRGLQSLLLYTNPEQLYRAALALYDLPLAYMVVDTAGLDPGDYLGDMQIWQAMRPEEARKAAIDSHLGNWASAIAHLAQIPEQWAFDKALSLAQNKGLLRQAMALYNDDGPRYKSVVMAYAESLAARYLYEDAAVAWLAAGELKEALQCYQEAGEWRQVMSLAHTLELSEAEVTALASDLAEEQRGAMGPVDAAALHLDYLQDVDGAVALLAQGRAWREALRTAARHKRQDLVKTVVVPAAADAAAALLRDTVDATERVAKYLARLREVRTKRLAMAEAMAADDLAEGDDIGDSASVISGMSAYTTTSTAAGTTSSVSEGTASTAGGRKAQKNKQRKQRRKGSGIRQGTVGEEHALAEHLASLEPTTQDLGQASQLCELLVMQGHVEDASKIQAALSKLAAAVKEAKEDAASSPPPPLPAAGDSQNEARRKQAANGEWKWAILRQPEQQGGAT